MAPATPFAPQAVTWRSSPRAPWAYAREVLATPVLQQRYLVRAASTPVMQPMVHERTFTSPRRTNWVWAAPGCVAQASGSRTSSPVSSRPTSPYATPRLQVSQARSISPVWRVHGPIQISQPQVVHRTSWSPPGNIGWTGTPRPCSPVQTALPVRSISAYVAPQQVPAVAIPKARAAAPKADGRLRQGQDLPSSSQAEVPSSQELPSHERAVNVSRGRGAQKGSSRNAPLILPPKEDIIEPVTDRQLHKKMNEAQSPPLLPAADTGGSGESLPRWQPFEESKEGKSESLVRDSVRSLREVRNSLQQVKKTSQAFSEVEKHEDTGDELPEEGVVPEQAVPDAEAAADAAASLCSAPAELSERIGDQEVRLQELHKRLAELGKECEGLAAAATAASATPPQGGGL